eukprot:1147703-Pelagomonas_calceolata.AAC.3
MALCLSRGLGTVMKTYVAKENNLVSKGFCWLATQDDSIIGWDNVGALLQIMKEGCWYACVPEVRRRATSGGSPWLCGLSLLAGHIMEASLGKFYIAQ